MRVIDRIKEVARSRMPLFDKARKDGFGHVDMWPTYNYDVWEYFANYPEIATTIRNYLRSHKGEEINHLDIAGNASFNVGSNTIFAEYSFERKKKKNDSNIVEGDIMEDGDFEKLIRKIKEEGNLLDIVTFQPVGGLHDYVPKDISVNQDHHTREVGFIDLTQYEIEFRLLKVFIRRLESVFQIMKPGGLLYLGESYLLNDYFVNEKVLFESLFKKLGFEIILSPVGIPSAKCTFLLKKIS